MRTMDKEELKMLIRELERQKTKFDKPLSVEGNEINKELNNAITGLKRIIILIDDYDITLDHA